MNETAYKILEERRQELLRVIRMHSREAELYQDIVDTALRQKQSAEEELVEIDAALRET